eukprot:UN08134
MSVTMSISISTKLNLHTGNATQTYSQPTITGIYKDGDSINHIGEGLITNELAALKPAFIGQNFDLTLSSKTLRP